MVMMKKVMKGTKIKEDCYIISENERKELVEYRKTFNKFHKMYTNYSKYYNS